MARDLAARARLLIATRSDLSILRGPGSLIGVGVPLHQRGLGAPINPKPSTGPARPKVAVLERIPVAAARHGRPDRRRSAALPGRDGVSSSDLVGERVLPPAAHPGGSVTVHRLNWRHRGDLLPTGDGTRLGPRLFHRPSRPA